MIDSIELRIGNHVKCLDGNIIKIDQDDFIDILCNTYDVEPILLTEEILLKCGFECVNQSEGNYFSLEINSNGDYLASNPDGFFFVLNNEDNFEDEYLPELSIKLDIHYLHKLQNIYHALTGQELKIEL